MCVSDLCHSSTVSPPPAGGIGGQGSPCKLRFGTKTRCLRASSRTALLRDDFLCRASKVTSHLLRRSSFPKCKQFLGLHFGFLFSRYISRYENLKFGFLPFVVASIIAMVFLRRICSSRPGDGEQRGQSLAALTARGRGLDCFQPQPRQPVLRAGQTLCVQTDWAA